MREPDGFGEFVSVNSRALLRAAWLLTGDWPAAEDLVQTALAAAWPARYPDREWRVSPVSGAIFRATHRPNAPLDMVGRG